MPRQRAVLGLPYQAGPVAGTLKEPGNGLSSSLRITSTWPTSKQVPAPHLALLGLRRRRLWRRRLWRRRWFGGRLRRGQRRPRLWRLRHHFGRVGHGPRLRFHQAQTGSPGALASAAATICAMAAAVRPSLVSSCASLSSRLSCQPEAHGNGVGRSGAFLEVNRVDSSAALWAGGPGNDFRSALALGPGQRIEHATPPKGQRLVYISFLDRLTRLAPWPVVPEPVSAPTLPGLPRSPLHAANTTPRSEASASPACLTVPWPQHVWKSHSPGGDMDRGRAGNTLGDIAEIRTWLEASSAGALPQRPPAPQAPQRTGPRAPGRSPGRSPGSATQARPQSATRTTGRGRPSAPHRRLHHLDAYCLEVLGLAPAAPWEEGCSEPGFQLGLRDFKGLRHGWGPDREARPGETRRGLRTVLQHRLNYPFRIKYTCVS